MRQPNPSHLESSSQSRTLWNNYLPYVLITILITVGILLRLSVYPLPWFDEGYTTHVAHLLAEKGIYGTYNGIRFSPYDPFVSSGPGVVLPIAFVYKLFGDGVLEARLALFPYSVLLGLCLYTLGRYLYGKTVAFLTIIAVLVSFQWRNATLDLSPLLLGRQVLGEIPAIATILLGLLILFKSWDRRSWLLTILAGVVCGIGVLSKMQTAFGALPALFFIACFRSIKNRRDIVINMLPFGIVLLIIVAWTGFQRLSAPAELRAEYSDITIHAIIVHYIIGLFGRVLDIRVILISAAAAFFIISRLIMLALSSRHEPQITNRQWAELAIIAFALFYLIWYYMLSVGWQRYMFPTFILACLIAAKVVWDIVHWLFSKPDGRLSKLIAYLDTVQFMVAVSILAFALIVIFILSWTDPNIDSAQKTIDYVRNNIPSEAMIESWEWELDSPSDHLNIHHPDAIYVIHSIWDLAMHQSIDLDYDMLQANPDYLITGRFNDLTNIYNFDDLDKNFELIEDFGLYHIYKRK